MTSKWGILGPGAIESTRRTRTLGLAASTRLFNELAVPGLGGVWFGKQLLLATLGVLVAEKAATLGRRVTRIEVANSIEALACWMALTGGSRAGEGRIRGSTKLAGCGSDDFSFRNVSRPSFYVTQPMRMATVNALPALGLVETTGSRFNSFGCSEAGQAFVEAACAGYRPFKHSVVEHLVQWVLGQTMKVDSPPLREALSQLTPMPPAALTLLRERLHQGVSHRPAWERQRRSDALHWVESRRKGALPATWDAQPTQISDMAHWSDMRAGARFFAACDAAQALLDAVERQIGTPENRFSFGAPLSDGIQSQLSQLQVKARAFLELRHTDKEANAFCREVIAPSGEDVLRELVIRDGRILKLAGDHVCPGPAFQIASKHSEVPQPDMEEGPSVDDPTWPKDISYRVRNLWWLSLDLQGDIEAWLDPAVEEVAYG